MTAAKTVFMFSGQGSQYFQMGKDLFEKNGTFRKCMTQLDSIVLETYGFSVVKTLYDNARTKAESFDQLLLTHPAIFMVEYALARALIEAGVQPDATLGTSLGTFAAAAISGYLSPEDALLEVLKQAYAFDSVCSKGGMIAVLAEPQVHESLILPTESEIASYNFRMHFVLSAPSAAIQKIEDILTNKNLPYQRLPVNYAFHSKWIDEVKRALPNSLHSRPLNAAKIPLVCCAHAEVMQELPAHYFWTVVREPIFFQKTIQKLEASATYRYIDVGPSGTLATFLKYVLTEDSKSEVFPIMTPYGKDVDRFAAIQDAVLVSDIAKA